MLVMTKKKCVAVEECCPNESLGLLRRFQSLERVLGQSFRTIGAWILLLERFGTLALLCRFSKLALIRIGLLDFRAVVTCARHVRLVSFLSFPSFPGLFALAPQLHSFRVWFSFRFPPLRAITSVGFLGFRFGFLGSVDGSERGRWQSIGALRSSVNVKVNG